MRRKAIFLALISPVALIIACSFSLTFNILTTTTLKSAPLFLESVFLLFISLLLLFYFLYLKNRKVFLKTFVSTLFLAGILSLLWYPKLFNRSDNPEPSGIITSVHNSQPENQKASQAGANWKTYINSTAGYSIKYPSAWFISTPETDPSHICTPENIFMAPNEKLLGVCASGFGGLIDIILTPHGFNLQKEIQSYQGHKLLQQTATLGGQKSVKFIGISQLKDEQADFTGTKMIVYLVERGDRTLIISYSQSPKWMDYSADFEKIVSTLKFTN